MVWSTEKITGECCPPEPLRASIASANYEGVETTTTMFYIPYEAIDTETHLFLIICASQRQLIRFVSNGHDDSWLARRT